MFPSKSMVDYMSEIHRLFPRSENEDSPSLAFNPFLSPFQSTRANRSSSSTDSFSPESYPEIFHSGEFVKRDEKLPSNNTPLTYRQQRPIIGRKILGTQQTQTLVPPTMDKMDFDIGFWQHEEPLPETPLENRTRSKKFLYELFPSDTKAIEFQTPIKSMQSNQLSDVSAIWSNSSPTLSKRSPIERNVSNLSPTMIYQPHIISNPSPGISHLSPSWSNSSQSSTFSSHVPNNFINTFSGTHFTPNYSNVGACSSSDEIAPTKMCTFCRKNGETPVVYMTHCVKQKIGNKNVVTCPILRSHVCGTCGASGDNAHTITYCPVLRSNNDGKPLQSTTITLKNTRIKSNGRRRY